MEKLWYVVNTYSGHESKVKEKLEAKIESMGMQDYIYRIVIPETTEVEVKDGVKKEKTKKMFPGYILVEMIMSDEAWYIVRNTPGVTGFIGSSGGGAKPLPVAEDEIQAILRKLGLNEQKIVVNFKEGDRVKILSGPFTNVEGTIERMDDEQEVATVLTIMFGHETPTEVSYLDLEKVD